MFKKSLAGNERQSIQIVTHQQQNPNECLVYLLRFIGYPQSTLYQSRRNYGHLILDYYGIDSRSFGKNDYAG